MRIDAHQHFWELDRFDYFWMPPEPTRLRRDFLPEHLGPILARNKFDGTVLVQALNSSAETEWLLQVAASTDFVLGVVGWADLTEPHLGDQLDVLQRHPKFRGLRHLVEFEADHRWLLRDDVLRGLKEVERRGLTFDLLVRPHHLDLLPELVEHVPTLPLVIDHMAKPPIRSGVLDGWAQKMERVARIPHLHVKISGMITEADPQNWKGEDLAPFARLTWDLFGPNRCMFGSDWPVCLTGAIWKQALAGFTQALGPIRKEIRSGIMGDNAARFYRLEAPVVASDAQADEPAR